MELRRGDLVVIVLPGSYGKPRPALVIQDDSFASMPSITVVPLTTTLIEAPLFRIGLDPAVSTGLLSPSQAMIDKVVTAPRSKVGRRIGEADPSTMAAVDTALSLFLGLRLTP